MRSSILVAITTMALSACTPFISLEWSDGWSTETGAWAYYDPDMQVQQARLSGELGPYEANTAEAWGWGTTWESGLMFDIRGRGNGVVMATAYVEIPELAEVQPGDVLGEDFDGWADMIVCAGQQEDYWEIDVGTEEMADIRVVDVTDEALTLSFVADPMDAPEPVSGEVVIPRL